MRISGRLVIAAAAVGILFVCAGCDSSASTSSADTETPSVAADTASAEASAASVDASPNQSSDVSTTFPTADPLKATLPVLGTIVTIDREQDIYYIQEQTEASEDADTQPEGQIGAVEADDCIIIDCRTGAEVDDDELTEGERVQAYVGLTMTRSIPPQAPCYAIITNLPESGIGMANYVYAAEVSTDADGNLRVLNQNADLYLTIPADIPIEVFDEGARTVSLSDVHAGSRLIAWYDEVMESYPAQAVATRVVIDLDD